jgi:transposase
MTTEKRTLIGPYTVIHISVPEIGFRTVRVWRHGWRTDGVFDDRNVVGRGFCESQRFHDPSRLPQ